MTMRERTEAGKLFTDYCEGLPEDRINCKKRMIQFNSTMPDDVKAIPCTLVGTLVSAVLDNPGLELVFPVIV